MKQRIYTGESRARADHQRGSSAALVRLLRSLPLAACLGCALVVLAAVSLPQRAQAATMLYTDVETLTEESSWVVDGVIVDSEVFIGEYGRITTRWKIAVLETIYGQPVAEVYVEQWAGTLDGVTMMVPGDAQLSLGERSIFFLHGEQPSQLYLTALGQSRYLVRPPSIGDDGEPILSVDGVIRALRDGPLSAELDSAEVSRDLSDISLYSTDGDPTVYRLEGPEVMSRSELIERVRAVSADER